MLYKLGKVVTTHIRESFLFNFLQHTRMKVYQHYETDASATKLITNILKEQSIYVEDVRHRESLVAAKVRAANRLLNDVDWSSIPDAQYAILTHPPLPQYKPFLKFTAGPWIYVANAQHLTVGGSHGFDYISGDFFLFFATEKLPIQLLTGVNYVEISRALPSKPAPELADIL